MSDEESVPCQKCGKEKATIHLTDFVDGKPVQRHLCESCYGQEDGLPALSPSKIVAQLIGTLVPELKELADASCPKCGMTYLQFRQTFLLGCPVDYEAFSAPLDQLLQSTQGATRHVGKVPVGTAQMLSRGPMLASLRRKLDEAVKAEKFEQAAQLRDKIKRLEQEGAGSHQE